MAEGNTMPIMQMMELPLQQLGQKNKKIR